MRNGDIEMFAISDWVIFISVYMLAGELVGPILVLFVDHLEFIYHFIMSIVAIILMCINSIVALLLYHFVCSRFYKKSSHIDENTQNIILSRLDSERGSIDVKRIKSLKSVLSDVSFGAHVRGVLRPCLTISGGMLIGLLRGETKAKCIFFHEYSHILNLDRLLPLLIGWIIYDVLAGVPMFSLVFSVEYGLVDSMILVTKYSVLIFFVYAISQSREYYADALSLSYYPKLSEYKSIFDGHKTNTGIFNYLLYKFHPSASRRIYQIENGFPYLAKAIHIKLFLLLMMTLDGYEILSNSYNLTQVLSQDLWLSIAVKEAFGGMIISTFILFVWEPFRYARLSKRATIVDR